MLEIISVSLDDTRREIVLMRRDITDLYEEEQRQKLLLQNAVNEANIANNAKSEFLSRMSHDMRTPLNAVLSFSDNDMIADATQQDLRNYIGKIHSSGIYLLGIINDVLDMSIIEQNSMVLNYSSYCFDEFKDLVNTIILQSCIEKNITFKFECSELNGKWIITDKVRFNQLFINLLSNAVKFTPPGGLIKMILYNKREQDQNSDYLRQNKNENIMQFVVSDNGIGMSSQFIPHAFDNFSQENNDRFSDVNRGTGLGLSIVKKIVELMNGKIAVHSEIHTGTTFVVDLPIKIVPKPMNTSIEPVREISLKGIRVLLCEDDDINAEIVNHILEKKGCIVERAANGEEGLKMFQESPIAYYKVILMDIRMPVMNGYEATIHIRSLYRKDASQIPVIALTADVFAHDEQVSEEVGMNAHISKPIDAEALYAMLYKYLV